MLTTERLDILEKKNLNNDITEHLVRLTKLFKDGSCPWVSECCLVTLQEELVQV